MSDQFRDYDFEQWLDEDLDREEQDADDRLLMARRVEDMERRQQLLAERELERQVNAFNAGFRRRDERRDHIWR